MASTPQTFEALRASTDNALNVRKALGVIVAVAPMSAPLVKTLVNTSGQITMPEGYDVLGLFTRDGLTFGAESDNEDVEALGYMSPVRRDISSITRTITLQAYEIDRRAIRELATGNNLSKVVPSAESGELIMDDPEVPVHSRRRLLAIARDINKANGLDILRAKFYPQVEISKMPEEQWGTDALQNELEFTNFLDQTAGYSVRNILAGPGLDAAKLGYGPAAGA